jgi:acetoin utilization deacetylase AcuC-like enzyme
MSNLLLITSNHDLKDDNSSDGLGYNKPKLRKNLIVQKLGQCNDLVTIQLVAEPLPDLTLATNVHEKGFTQFLNNCFNVWMSLSDDEVDWFFSAEGTRDNGDRSMLVPAQCAARNAYQRPGPSVFSQCCYYAMDRLTPIKASTALTLRYDLAVVQQAVEAIKSNKAKYIYACTTEPGHHASSNSYGGYCMINNAAVAADLLVKHYQASNKAARVGILDVDYHSGNGTMEIFYDRSDVYFASLHMNIDLDYPYNCGYNDQTGSGQGEGFTININLPSQTDWTLYKQHLQQVLSIFASANLSGLVVSLGADTVEADPEASPIATMKLTDSDYIEMGQMIRSLDVCTIYIQEGGYHMEKIAQVIANVVCPDQATKSA